MQWEKMRKYSTMPPLEDLWVGVYVWPAQRKNLSLEIFSYSPPPTILSIYISGLYFLKRKPICASKYFPKRKLGSKFCSLTDYLIHVQFSRTPPVFFIVKGCGNMFKRGEMISPHKNAEGQMPCNIRGGESNT